MSAIWIAAIASVATGRAMVGTGSGRIVLSVPAGFSADMEASSGNGDVTTDLPIRLQGRIARNRLRGQLGEGGERLSLSTGNGDIEIRRAR